MPSEKQSFPYAQLLGAVLASLSVTVVLFWVWHMVEMHQLRAQHDTQSDPVRAEIKALHAHIATFATSSTKTVK